MKLRNKKTGMIGEVGYLASSSGEIIVNNINDQEEWYTYNSLAELSEEWEDYEEPEGWWFIGRTYEPHATNSTLRSLEADRQIGNYFATKKEAEKVVEKLKAWKRLKDAGLKFTDFSYNLDETSSSTISANGKICFGMMCYEDFSEDLDLLFGGEDETI